MELEKQLHSTKDDNIEKVDILNNLFWQIWAIDPNRANNLSVESFDLAQKLDYAKGLAYAKSNLGMMFYSQAKIEKALASLLDALEWFEENKEMEGEAHANHGLALLYWGFGDFQRGFDAIFKTLKIYRDMNICDGKGWTCNTLGGFYYDWKDYKQSREYFKKALIIFTDTKNQVGIARALNGIGNAYHCMGNHTKALTYQNKSLKIQQSAKNIIGESKTLNDIGLMFQSQKEYEKALDCHYKSLEIRQKVGYPQGETTNLLDIGNIYIAQKKYDEALAMFHKALALSEKIKAKIKMSKAHQALSRIYKQTGQNDKALEHHEQFHTIDEEVFHEDNDKKLKNLRAAYQIEASKKEAEIYRLKNVELKTKNQELKQTLNKLNATQAQLLQSSKMVALGQLVAGVTHEINNPLGAIISAVDVAERANVKVINMLKSDEFQNKINNNELKSTLEIISQSTQISATGTTRISKIIQSLKNFSRLDEAPFQKTNIHEGLESTLTLMGHELKNGIKIQKNYGTIPEIYSYPSELNQVFMNLVMNGIQAIKGKGTITISTYFDNGYVLVSIADTGKGLSQEKIEQLFEPGFTERQSQIRMRTGLYASYNIIQKHKGDIKVESELGKGTTFTVSLPDNLSDSRIRK